MRSSAPPHLVLAEPPGVADPVEKLPAGGVLHHDRQVRRRDQHLRRAGEGEKKEGTISSSHKQTNPRPNHVWFTTRNTHLLEPDDVGMPQRAVVDDLPRHILVNLQNRPRE
jgi:hypothetical protein